MVNWDAIGAVGELLGAILLIASLIYVALQIRDAKTQIKSATSQARSESFQNLFAMRVKPELANAELLSRRSPEELTDTDRFYMTAFLTMFLNHYQNIYYQQKVGALEREQTGALDTLPLFKATPYYIEMWRGNFPKDSYNAEFTQHIESVVSSVASNMAA